jgi:predicted nucleotidyltransferase
MPYNWLDCPIKVKDFVLNLLNGIKNLLNDDFVGFYLHGSLAMGGYNPSRSDIDILVVTSESISVQTKRELAKFFLHYSANPYPVEISFLNEKHIGNWIHFLYYEFHYSEFWRERYKNDMSKSANLYINEQIQHDSDLAAHIMITNHRGICIEGKPIVDVFPLIPEQDYLSSIKGDYLECLEKIEEDPIYCVLNMMRVYLYVKSEMIVSKHEAGTWGLSGLPDEIQRTIKSVMTIYCGEKGSVQFTKKELFTFSQYIDNRLKIGEAKGESI